jgi:arginase
VREAIAREGDVPVVPRVTMVPSYLRKGIALMAVSLIEVPYMLGDDRHSAATGPDRLVQQGAVDLFRQCGTAVRLERIQRRGAYRDTATASLDVCKEIAATVERAIVVDDIPLVLAGSCDVSKGVLSGFDHDRCGIVWIDAHADFNTPETTVSGFFAGMSLAIVLGHCYTSLWAEIGNSTPIPEDRTLLLGVRDVDPAERVRLADSSVDVVRWQKGEPASDIGHSLDRLSAKVDDVYLHIDLDALDPRVAPGVVDKPVPAGLSIEDLMDVIEAIAVQCQIRAATLATYNPQRDEDAKTANACLRVIDKLARVFSRSRTTDV